MNDYISRDTAVCIADYAADEHPYEKDPAKPETFSEYNQGWHDACDYIRERMENAGKADDVIPVRHEKWTDVDISGKQHYRCTGCGEYIEGRWTANFDYRFCPNCGAYMDWRR